MLPLAHRRILVTRPRGQASALADLLSQQGAVPILIPTIEIAPPVSFQALDHALRTLHTFDWLILTSANAVHALTARAVTLGLTLAPDSLPSRIAVIGPATAAAMQNTALHQQSTIMPPRFIAESLVEILVPHALGARMLLIRASEARDILPQTLENAGAFVTIAEAYRNVVPPDSIADLQTLLQNNPPEAITFTSASTARNLVALLEAASLTLPHTITLASIGPITSAAMHTVGLTPTIEAEEATIPSLVEALATHFSPGNRGPRRVPTSS